MRASLLLMSLKEFFNIYIAGKLPELAFNFIFQYPAARPLLMDF